VQDRRSTQRTPIFKAAQLFSEQCRSVVHCTVRDVSTGGAGLQLATAIVLPEAFELSFDSFCSARWCHVRWRAETRLGVSFGAEVRPGR
jgi:hypothetical protein